MAVENKIYQHHKIDKNINVICALLRMNCNSISVPLVHVYYYSESHAIRWFPETLKKYTGKIIKQMTLFMKIDYFLYFINLQS